MPEAVRGEVLGELRALSILDEAEDVIADALDALEAGAVGKAKRPLRDWLEPDDEEALPPALPARSAEM